MAEELILTEAELNAAAARSEQSGERTLLDTVSDFGSFITELKEQVGHNFVQAFFSKDDREMIVDHLKAAEEDLRDQGAQLAEGTLYQNDRFIPKGIDRADESHVKELETVAANIALLHQKGGTAADLTGDTADEKIFGITEAAKKSEVVELTADGGAKVTTEIDTKVIEEQNIANREVLTEGYYAELVMANKQLAKDLTDGKGKNDAAQTGAYVTKLQDLAGKFKSVGETAKAEGIVAIAEKIDGQLQDGVFINTGTSLQIKGLEGMIAKMEGVTTADKALAAATGIVTAMSVKDAQRVLTGDGTKVDSRVGNSELAGILSDPNITGDIAKLKDSLGSLQTDTDIAALMQDANSDLGKAPPATIDSNAMSKTEVAV